MASDASSRAGTSAVEGLAFRTIHKIPGRHPRDVSASTGANVSGTQQEVSPKASICSVGERNMDGLRPDSCAGSPVRSGKGPHFAEDDDGNYLNVLEHYKRGGFESP